MDNYENKALGAIKWTSVATIITIILQFLQITILARILDPNDFGVIAIVFIVIGFSKIFNETGLSEAIIQRKNITKEEISSLYWLNVIFGLFISLTIILVAPLLSNLYGEEGLRALLYVATVAIFISSFSNQFHALMRKYFLFNKLAFIDVFSSLMGTFVTIITAWKYDQGYWSFIWGLIIQSVIKLILLLLYNIKNVGLPRFHCRYDEVKSYINFSLYRSGGMIANYLGSRIDQLFVGNLLGSAALGYYNVAVNVTLEPASRLNPIINRVALPYYSVLQDNINELKKGFINTFKILFFLNAPIFIGIFAISPVAVPLIFGEKWVDVVPIIQVLSFVAITKTIGSITGSLILAKGYANWSFYWNIITLVFIPIVIYLSAQSGSLIIVTISIAILRILLILPMYYIVIKKIIGPVGKVLIIEIMPTLIISFIMATIVILLNLLIDDYSLWSQMIYLFIVGVIVYASLAYYFQKDMIVTLQKIYFGK